MIGERSVCATILPIGGKSSDGPAVMGKTSVSHRLHAATIIKAKAEFWTDEYFTHTQTLQQQSRCFPCTPGIIAGRAPTSHIHNLSNCILRALSEMLGMSTVYITIYMPRSSETCHQDAMRQFVNDGALPVIIPGWFANLPTYTRAGTQHTCMTCQIEHVVT
jgi:hypothetical protein